MRRKLELDICSKTPLERRYSDMRGQSAAPVLHYGFKVAWRDGAGMKQAFRRLHD
ncbi:MAG: hypothetical protein ABJN40_18420 [Sneathiella sp.]